MALAIRFKTKFAIYEILTLFKKPIKSRSGKEEKGKLFEQDKTISEDR